MQQVHNVQSSLINPQQIQIYRWVTLGLHTKRQTTRLLSTLDSHRVLLLLPCTYHWINLGRTINQKSYTSPFISPQCSLHNLPLPFATYCAYILFHNTNILVYVEVIRISSNNCWGFDWMVPLSVNASIGGELFRNDSQKTQVNQKLVFSYEQTSALSIA